MSENNTYLKLVDEYTQKEEELLAKIKFYKENRDTILRIKILEKEIESLNQEISNLADAKMREIVENKNMQEYMQICADNCKDAFQLYILNKRNCRKNSNNIQMNTICRRYYINYTFTEINKNEYNVSKNIPNYGYPASKIMNGVYNKETDILSDLK